VADTWDVRGDFNGVVRRTRATWQGGVVSSASACKRGCTRRAFPGSPSAQAICLRGDSFFSHPDKLRKLGTVVPLFLRHSHIYSGWRASRTSRADKLHSLSLCALPETREHTNRLKGVRESGEEQQETPHALQEGELRSWFRIGEAHSAFRAGAPFRPLFCPIPSNLFRDGRIPQTNHPPTTLNGWAVTARGKYP